MSQITRLLKCEAPCYEGETKAGVVSGSYLEEVLRNALSLRSAMLQYTNDCFVIAVVEISTQWPSDITPLVNTRSKQVAFLMDP